MWIDTKIVYEPGRELAKAYNRAMESTLAEWVLFIDHDVFLSTNPLWHQMSLNAIEHLKDKKVGWITAKTNRIGNKSQLYPVQNDSDDLNQHIDIASKLYREKAGVILPAKGNLSGFFILTNKTAWQSVGGFKDQGKGLSAIDNVYSKELRAKGFGLYVMEGLYLYHFYKKRKKELYSKF
jgi:GT2 family glycosyltransferase